MVRSHPRVPFTRKSMGTTRDQREEAYAYIVALVEDGLSIEWIGRQTGLAGKTVDTMLRGVRRKLGPRAYASIVALYEEWFIDGA